MGELAFCIFQFNLNVGNYTTCPVDTFKLVRIVGLLFEFESAKYFLIKYILGLYDAIPYYLDAVEGSMHTYI